MNNNHIWVGWLVVFTVFGLLLAKGTGLLPEIAVVNAAPAETVVVPTAWPSASPMPERQVLMPLTACGLPDRVGAFRSGNAPCRPTSAWTLGEFTPQLVGLNVLIEGETLAAPPTSAEARCPWLVMRGQAATGAKVCFTPQGGIYRGMGGAHDDSWNWQLDVTGQWMLNMPAVAGQ